MYYRISFDRTVLRTTASDVRIPTQHVKLYFYHCEDAMNMFGELDFEDEYFIEHKDGVKRTHIITSLKLEPYVTIRSQTGEDVDEFILVDDLHSFMKLNERNYGKNKHHDYNAHYNLIDEGFTDQFKHYYNKMKEGY